METCLTFQAFFSRSASSSRHSPTRWMEGESVPLSRVSTAPRMDFLGERGERSEGADGRNTLRWVLGRACANQCQRERHGNLRACTGPEWLSAEPSTPPASAWRHLRTVPEHATTGKCDRLWNEATRSESEQTIHRQTRLGSCGTRTASRSETMVAAQSRCETVRCAPSDAHFWTRRIGSCCPDCKPHLRWTACKWNGRRDDPTVLHDRGRKTPSRMGCNSTRSVIGCLHRHYSVMQAGWNVVKMFFQCIFLWRENVFS